MTTLEQRARDLAAYCRSTADNISPVLHNYPADVLLEVASGIDELRAALSNVRRKTLREAWHIAKDGCLVPPDGGSPTEDEVELCDRIAARIDALIDTPASDAPDPRDAGSERFREVVTACGTQFRYYERQHLAKSPPDVTKAKTNADFAELCETARQTLDRESTKP